jgi:hypothetical protein
VVLVKRAGLQWCRHVRAAGKPIVWDALDFWSQPAQNAMSEAQAVQLLHQQIAQIQPALVIGATVAMATACDGFYLPHQAWPTLAPTPARARIQTVGYDGNVLYLGRWRGILDAACLQRDWTFVINPPDLAQVDLLVAFRDAQWDGWICREWKSGVKLVNAIAAGRPILMQASAAAREIKPAGTVVETAADLHEALDFWRDEPRRAAVVEQSTRRASAYAIAELAASYRQALTSLQVAA